MVFKHIYRIGLEDCGRESKATNKAILTILEDIAGLHSATVGLGLNEISKTGCAWVVLNWQMQIIKRPAYNDELTAYTWSTSVDKLFAERDFRITDKNGDTIVIATSRWIYMDINRRRPVRITPKIMDRYESEPENRVFTEKITKTDIPDTDYIEIAYNILRRDVDHLGHMHNISYLDAAYDVMPEEYFNGPHFNFVSIEYRKELLKNDDVKIHFYKIDNGCIISLNTDKINSVITLKY